MSDPRRCHVCGAVLVEGRLTGLCPACTWRGLVEIEDEEAMNGVPIRSGLMRVAGYEVLGEIARGGMGIVYRAKQLEPPRTVALKMLLPHQLGSFEMAERFRMEVRALTELDHPAILPVYQVGEQDGLPFFTMKLATGGSLAERKKEFSGNWRAIGELIATLADAMHFAHEHGVLHRDLKPGNVLFDEAGRPYVSDFGLAKVTGTDSDLTRSSDFLGTPHYVAPEVASQSVRQATTASDIYSLGAVLYELVTGRPPFEAEGIPALLKKISDAEPPRLGSTVPRDLGVICLKCLTKNPRARYVTARELAEDLRRWLAGRTILARPASKLERAGAWSRRNPALATAAGLLLIVFVAAIFLQAQANRTLKRALVESLLSQTRLLRSSGRAGQRFETLSLVGNAIKLWPNGSDAASDSTLAALRSEVAGALALPDLRAVARWPVTITHFENDFGFTADLERYVVTTADGGFAVRTTKDHRSVWEYRGVTNNQAIEIRISPDGLWVAANFQDGHLELHSVRARGVGQRFGGNRAEGSWRSLADARGSEEPVRRWEGQRSARAHVAFAPGSDRVAASPVVAGAYVDIVDLASNRIEGQLAAGQERTMAFNGTGTELAIAGRGLAVWGVKETNRLWSIPLPNHASAVAWSPDGRWLAVALDRRQGPGGEAFNGDPILLYDAVSGARKSVLAEASTRSEWVAFHPDGNSVVAATWGNELLWISLDAPGFRLMAAGAQRGLSFNVDGTRLAYAPSKEELGLLEVATPSVLREWKMASAPARESFTLAVSRDGRWVASGSGNGVRLWDAQKRVEVASLPLPSPAWWVTVLFGADDECVYYSASSFGVRRIELVRTNGTDGHGMVQFGRERLIGPGSGFTATSFGADGRSLIVGESHRETQNERGPPTMWLWADGDPGRARKLAENFRMVGYRALPGGQWGVSTDGIAPDLSIWDFRTGQRVRGLGIPLPVNSEPTRDGRWLITRTRAEAVVWEVGTWRRVAQWPAGEGEEGWIVSSPDSRLVATAASDGRLTLRELPNGREVMALPLPHGMRLFDWRFSPDGRRIFLLPSTGQVFEWQLAEIQRELAKLGLNWK